MRVYKMVHQNKALGEEWRRRILWAQQKNAFDANEDPLKRKVCVLVNPFGGAGAAAAALV